MQYNMNFNSILSKTPRELADWLLQEFPINIPEAVITMDDMLKAQDALLKLGGAYSYLVILQSYAKIRTREAKRYLSKEEHEDMVDRKEIIENFADAVKQGYSAVSRAVTIHTENNNELRMSRGIT